MKSDVPPPGAPAVLEFMFRLGQSYLACGEQTAKVELSLRRVASAYGIRRSRVVTFPTAVFITLCEGEQEHVTVAEGPKQILRLDQIADVYALGAAAQRGEISPADGLRQLNEIQRKKPRFGTTGAIFGNMILAVGLAMILKPGLSSLGAAAILGAIVGALKLLNRDRAALAVPMPVLAATLVSALVYLAVKYNLLTNPSQLLIPPLVTFLPGAMLTLGMVELAYGDMVSGSSRLVTGFVQLVLLAFGLAVGAALVGVGAVELAASNDLAPAISWAPWAGVAVFCTGVFLHFSAPPKSFLWMLLVLFLAFGAQRLSAHLVGNDEISGFFGMLVATPLGYLIQLRFNGPPAMVTFLPSFWLLVPGALGLMSVTRMLSDRTAGIDGLTTAVFAIASIALGTLLGASVYKWITETFGWWQLQMGRASSYFRRDRKR